MSCTAPIAYVVQLTQTRRNGGNGFEGALCSPIPPSHKAPYIFHILISLPLFVFFGFCLILKVLPSPNNEVGCLSICFESLNNQLPLMRLNIWWTFDAISSADPNLHSSSICITNHIQNPHQITPVQNNTTIY